MWHWGMRGNFFFVLWYFYFLADICTLRLDFETFNIGGTSGTGGTDTTDGQCTDTFIATVILHAYREKLYFCWWYTH